MRMVRQGYMPVYRPQSFRFGEAAVDPLGRPTQRVTIVGPDGKTYEALYSMQRQSDGSWRYALVEGLDAVVTLDALGCELRLADVYAGVSFPAPESAEVQSDHPETPQE